MIAPRITLVQALVTLIIATGGFFLSYYIAQHAKKNRYPAMPVISVILLISAWLIVIVIDDRTTYISLNIFFSQVAYFIPLLIFLLFTNFALRYPPLSKKIHQKIYLAINVALVLLAGAIIFNPAGLVEYFDFQQQTLTVNFNPYYFVVMGSYLAQLTGITWIFAGKWKKLGKLDKKVLKIIGGSFYTTALIGFTLEVVIALTPLTVSSYVYAYFATLIFMIATSYAILRYGALDVGITFSRNVLYRGITIGLLLLFGYTYWLLQKNLSLDLRLAQRVSLMVFLGLTGYFIVESLIDRYLKKYDHPEPFKPYTNTANFLADLKSRYHLSKCLWQTPEDSVTLSRQSGESRLIGPAISDHQPTTTRDDFKSRALNTIKSIVPHRLSIKQRPAEIALNEIDARKQAVINLGARSFRDAGPNRFSIAITTPKGIFVAGHKYYNLAFGESELQLLRHEVNLHSSQLEIRDIKEARANHVHQLEQLSEAKKTSLQKANKKLRNNLQRRAKFFQSIAAELRTPLTIIEAALSENTLGLGPTKTESLKDNNRRLLSLTRELDLTGGTPSTETQAQTINLQSLSQTYRRRYARQLKRKQIKLFFFVFPVDSKISLNPTHFEQILDNLISNAIKYSPAGTSITTRLNVFPGRLLLQISDQGVGIKQSEQHLIFEPFFRTGTVKNIKGTGLGLSAVKRIATLYQGDAWVKSNKDRGSTFEVELKVSTEIPHKNDTFFYKQNPINQRATLNNPDR